MAKIIGRIDKAEITKRIHQARKVRYRKPLKVNFGAILKKAMEDANAN